MYILQRGPIQLLEHKWEVILPTSSLVLDGIVLFPWTDCSAFSFLFFLLQNETISAGNDICSPAKRQSPEMDSPMATGLGHVFPVHAHEN